MLHSGNTLQVRRFSPPDAASIVTWPQSITEAQWWAGPQTDWPISLDVVQHWHSDLDVHPYILTDGTTPLAYGELWIDAEEQEVELARLIVAPAHRGQGVGVALVRSLIEEGRRTNYLRAFLRLFPDNHIALACYLRTGFLPVSPAEQQSFNQGQPTNYIWMGHVLSKQ